MHKPLFKAMAVATGEEMIGYYFYHEKEGVHYMIDGEYPQNINPIRFETVSQQISGKWYPLEFIEKFVIPELKSIEEKHYGENKMTLREKLMIRKHDAETEIQDVEDKSNITFTVGDIENGIQLTEDGNNYVLLNEVMTIPHAKAFAEFIQKMESIAD